MSAPRWRAFAGIAGPATFIAAWSVLGATRSGYSPVHDPISRLAAVEAASVAYQDNTTVVVVEAKPD